MRARPEDTPINREIVAVIINDTGSESNVQQLSIKSSIPLCKRHV